MFAEIADSICERPLVSTCLNLFQRLNLLVRLVGQTTRAPRPSAKVSIPKRPTVWSRWIKLIVGPNINSACQQKEEHEHVLGGARCTKRQDKSERTWKCLQAGCEQSLLPKVGIFLNARFRVLSTTVRSVSVDSMNRMGHRYNASAIRVAFSFT